jgi:hypothetical protein
MAELSGSPYLFCEAEGRDLFEAPSRPQEADNYPRAWIRACRREAHHRLIALGMKSTRNRGGDVHAKEQTRCFCLPEATPSTTFDLHDLSRDSDCEEPLAVSVERDCGEYTSIGLFVASRVLRGRFPPSFPEAGGFSGHNNLDPRLPVNANLPR